MRGRKPVPTAMKVLTGNPGCRPIRKDEPEPMAGMPEPPDWLSEYAADEWRDRGPGLTRMRVLTKDDVAVFAAYCQAVADVRLAREQMQQIEQDASRRINTLVMKPEKGPMRRNILYVIAKESAQDVVRYAAELGLTPSARARVSTIPAGENQSELSKLMYVEKGKDVG